MVHGSIAPEAEVHGTEGLSMLSVLECPLTTSSRKTRVLPGDSTPRHATNEQTNKKPKNHRSDKGRKDVQTTGAQQVHKRCAVHTYVSVNAPFSVLRRKISVNFQLR